MFSHHVTSAPSSNLTSRDVRRTSASRRRSVRIASAGVLGVGMVAALASTASARPIAAQSSDSVHPNTVCYSQTATDGHSVVSDQFVSTAADTNRAVDDFMMSPGCNVTAIWVPGTYSNSLNKAQKVDVQFYNDCAGKPCPGTIGSFNNVNGNFHTGNFSIKLPGTVPISANVLYWVSVQAKMPNTATTWSWDTVVPGAGTPADARWRNPGGGWVTPTVSLYTDITTVWPATYPNPNLGMNLISYP